MPILFGSTFEQFLLERYFLAFVHLQMVRLVQSFSERLPAEILFLALKLLGKWFCTEQSVGVVTNFFSFCCILPIFEDAYFVFCLLRSCICMYVRTCVSSFRNNI
jgi:hypothetical protein